MANAGPNDNQSQFFFTLGATPELNGKHTIFGKVISNLTEALKIKNRHTICACVTVKLIIFFFNLLLKNVFFGLVKLTFGLVDVGYKINFLCTLVVAELYISSYLLS